MTNDIVAKDDTSLSFDCSQEVERGLSFADKFINRNYLIGINNYPVLSMPEPMKRYNNIRLLRLERFVYNEKEDVNDKLVSVYNALQSLESSAVLIINSSASGIEFYVGVYSDKNASTAGMILEKSITGNFPGSVISTMRNQAIRQTLIDIVSPKSYGSTKNVAAVSIVPSARDDDKEKFVQGIEKFIDTMSGSVYTAVIMATPLSKPVLEERKRGLEELYSTISPFASTSLSYGTNDSRAVTSGNFRSFSTAINKSVSNSNTFTSGENKSSTDTSSRGHSFGFGGFGTNSGKSKSSTSGYSSSNSWAKSVTEGKSESIADGESSGETLTSGDTRNLTLNHENKSVQNLMKQIEEHLDRIKECESFGLWECAGYFVSHDIQTAVVAANTYKALMAGTKSSVENSFVNIWDSANIENTNKVLEYIGYCVQPQIELTIYPEFGSKIVSPACMISGNEMPILMGFPRHSVTGLTVLTMAEFGRNIYSERKCDDGAKIRIGKVFHMGREEDTEVMLDIDSLAAHCFITGSTGSGKSHTSYQLLTELMANNIKFLVVEPAKGEYKKDLGGVENINIFCTNPQLFRMLKLNPFKFHDNIHVLEHLERLIEIFSACWPLYAAMPAILKDSIEKAYERCGWDLGNSIYFPNEHHKFPTFNDILTILPEIINQSEYSADAKGDYIGSLVTRVRSLTVGITGQVFCDSQDIPDNVLFDENTIIDLSRVGSTETKALIMGILVLKINEYRIATATAENVPLKHVTVLEEAHNLLKKTSSEQSQDGANLVGKSVEMICNSIAEMRTYGEGFILIDQSPTSVDISAIKNTNTKIIMRLPEQADCEAVGSALSLNEQQICELSKLGRGKAVIQQNDWLEAVLTSVSNRKNKYKSDVVITTHKSLAKVRSAVIAELFRQYSYQRYDIDAYKSIIDNSGISPHKMKELRSEIESTLSGKLYISKREMSEMVLAFLGCKGLLSALTVSFEGVNILKPECITSKMREDALSWYDRFYSALDTYFVSQNPALKTQIAKYILYAMAREFTYDDRYLFIYECKFN